MSLFGGIVEGESGSGDRYRRVEAIEEGEALACLIRDGDGDANERSKSIILNQHIFTPHEEHNFTERDIVKKQQYRMHMCENDI